MIPPLPLRMLPTGTQVGEPDDRGLPSKSTRLEIAPNHFERLDPWAGFIASKVAVWMDTAKLISASEGASPTRYAFEDNCFSTVAKAASMSTSEPSALSVTCNGRSMEFQTKDSHPSIMASSPSDVPSNSLAGARAAIVLIMACEVGMAASPKTSTNDLARGEISWHDSAVTVSHETGTLAYKAATRTFERC